MSLHHGLTDLHDNYLACFTAIERSSMVPGNVSSQLDILSTGQAYHPTSFDSCCVQPHGGTIIVHAAKVCVTQQKVWTLVGVTGLHLLETPGSLSSNSASFCLKL